MLAYEGVEIRRLTDGRLGKTDDAPSGGVKRSVPARVTLNRPLMPVVAVYFDSDVKVGNYEVYAPPTKAVLLLKVEAEPVETATDHRLKAILAAVTPLALNLIAKYVT